MTLTEKIIDNTYSRLATCEDRQRAVEMIKAIEISSLTSEDNGTRFSGKIPAETRKRLCSGNGPVVKEIVRRLKESGMDVEESFPTVESRWSMTVFSELSTIYSDSQELSAGRAYIRKPIGTPQEEFDKWKKTKPYPNNFVHKRIMSCEDWKKNYPLEWERFFNN